MATVVARLTDAVGAGVLAEAPSAVAPDEEHGAGRPGAPLYAVGVVAAEEQDASAGDGGAEHVVDVALVVQPPAPGPVDVQRKVTGSAARLPVPSSGTLDSMKFMSATTRGSSTGAGTGPSRSRR